MNKPKGLLSPAELGKLVQQGEIETVVAGFTDHYGRLVGKRFDAEMFVDEVLKHGGHACDYLLTVDVKSEKTHDYVDVAPRSILRRQVEAAKKAGFTGYAATELEHYLFQTSYRQAAQQDYRNLEAAGWYLEDY